MVGGGHVKEDEVKRRADESGKEASLSGVVLFP
jgi:hypothetical protein